MKKHLAFLWTLLMAGCAQTPLSHEILHPVASVQTERAFPTLQAIVDQAVHEGRVPAVSVAIGIGDEPTIFISAGRLTLETGAPASEDSLWRIYSMTKPVTGIAAIMLVDEGKLKLDQPISDFIPQFEDARVLVDFREGLETRPAAREITVRDLLTHTSGLAYSAGGADFPIAKVLLENGVTPHTASRDQEAELRPLRAPTLQEFARRAASSGLLFDPGEAFAYSMSLDVLAAVVEKASGMPFEAFLQNRLFDPLDMASTYWQVPHSEAARLATNYVASTEGMVTKLTPLDPAEDSVFLDPPSFPYGGAGLVSSARDFDRLLHMLHNDGQLDGARVMRPEAARLVRTNLLPANMVLTDKGPMLPGEPYGFGAGGFVSLESDSLGREPGTFGWDGAAGTRAWVDSARRVRVTTMLNVVGGSGVSGDIDRAIAADLAAVGR